MIPKGGVKVAGVSLMNPPREQARWGTVVTVFTDKPVSLRRREVERLIEELQEALR